MRVKIKETGKIEEIKSSVVGKFNLVNLIDFTDMGPTMHQVDFEYIDYWTKKHDNLYPRIIELWKKEEGNGIAFMIEKWMKETEGKTYQKKIEDYERILDVCTFEPWLESMRRGTELH